MVAVDRLFVCNFNQLKLDFFLIELFFLSQIVVQIRDEGNGWIFGRTGSVEGAFPATYVEKVTNNGPD